jgi:hypothetical protein
MRREKMGRIRGTYGAEQKYVCTGFWCRNVKEYLNDLDVDGRTVLKRVLMN